jgi:hypothetical protein
MDFDRFYMSPTLEQEEYNKCHCGPVEAEVYPSRIVDGMVAGCGRMLL